MKNIKLILMSAVVFVLSGCNYLDVVPDGVVEIETQFANQAGVRSALGACYSYMPNENHVHDSFTTAGDEYGFPETSGFLTGAYTRGHTLTRGYQNASNPVLNYWEGSGFWGNSSKYNLYEGIRYCNVFLENVNKVTGVPQSMVEDWTAQVIVLRAYYHYILMRSYGPVLIYKSSLDLSSTPEQIRAFRTPLEECFKFIIGEYDRALAMKDFTNNRRQSRIENTLIDKVVTRALKAKACLLRASKIFNGNNLYENFRDSRGRLMIDAAHYEGDEIWTNRWKDAQKAIDEAIKAAEDAGLGLYEYTDTPPDWDRNNFKSPEDGGSEIIQYCYNLRYMIVQPDVTTNKEVVWPSGATNLSYSLQTATQVRTFSMTDAAGNFYNDDGNMVSTYAFGYTGASYAMEEAFYSKNGVPIEEDKTYDYAHRTSLVTVPDDPYYRSYMTVGKTTVKLHLDREPRYYAWLLVDKGQYRDYDKLIPDVDFMKSGWTCGKLAASSPHDYIATGVGIKKFVHPASKNLRLSNVVRYAFPIIRMADLYLMKAEAYCMLGEDLATAIDAIDKVRARAGLKGVVEAWENYSNNPGKPSTKEGLMEIIKKERQVELCFEGARYFDVVRWMDADKEFTKPFQGWNWNSTNAQTLYRLTTYYTTQWSNKNYLWPISVKELNKNPNLVQNPWW